MQTALVAKLSDNWVFLALGGILLAFLVAILIANDGVFVYTLDDPYIHLQFSTQLWRGHFGLIPEEISSPSSSVLWPLLLAPFSSFAFHQFVPLLLNVAATFGSLALWRRALRHFVLQSDDRGAGHIADILALAILLTTNALGVVFSGMEHPLQVLATLAAVLGAIEFIETRRIRWWLVAAIIAGPLLRYENIPISVAALAVMVAGGAWGWALIGAAAAAAGLGVFAAVSLSLGLPFIPGSVQVKSSIDGNAWGMLASLRHALGNFAANLLRYRWPLDGILIIALLLARPFLRHEFMPLSRWLLLAGVTGAVGLQFILGAHFDFGRYDCFSFNAGLLCCAYFYRNALRAAVGSLPGWRAGVAGFVFLFALTPGSAGALWLTPLAAQDIYRQQWQMRRFLATLGDEGVAVNDVGLASYRSGQRVLDLLGLGSEEVRRRRMAGDMTGPQIKAMMTERKISALLVYPLWFDVRGIQDAEMVARFKLGRDAVSSARNEVALYGIDVAAAARLRRKAIEFASSMPRGTTLEIVSPPAGVSR